MIFLKNDYSEGMHQKILEALVKTNDEQQMGYGLDEHSIKACELIKTRIGKPNADVHLLVGGTQTNLIALSSFLKPVEAVIATDLGHIAVHETGAIEATGHKIIEMPSLDGKMTTEMIEKAVNMHTDEHMVVPKLVFISNSTELGTIYTKSELVALKKKCDEFGLYLYLDGARLGVALSAKENDLTIEDIANLCDAFYIGGTKSGAMIGEALIILNDNLKSYMRYYIKQKGGLLAKGRYLGIQFETLLEDDLMFKISEHANIQAEKITVAFEQLGYKLSVKQQTNQVFVKMNKENYQKISKFCHCSVTRDFGKDVLEVRFVTSFATCNEDIEEFVNKIKKI